MLVAAANLAVFPLEILPIAIPLSLLEAFVASYIMYKVPKKQVFTQKDNR